MNEITVGSIVTVRLYTGRTIEGAVKAIIDKVEGPTLPRALGKGRHEGRRHDKLSI